MRKIVGLFLLASMVIACDNTASTPNPIIGKWKIYKTNIAGKDISKSADPTNENGMEFKENGVYISFGNPGHEDNGTFELSPNNQELTFKSKKAANSSTKANVMLKNDSLELKFQLEEGKELYMGLFRMKE